MEKVSGARGAGDLKRMPLGQGFLYIGVKGPHRLTARVVEIIVGRVFRRDQGNFQCLGNREEACGPDGLQANARIGIGG